MCLAYFYFCGGIMAVSDEYENQIVDYFRHMMYGAVPPAKHYNRTKISMIKRDQIIASQFASKSQFLLYRVPFVNAYCLCSQRCVKK